MSYKISEETVVGNEKQFLPGWSDSSTEIVVATGRTRRHVRQRSGSTAAESMKIYGQKNSLLEKKAFLQFEYPNTTDPNGPPIMVRLPFYEDPEIRESKSARYASMKPLSRASELFAYLGSDARTFSLSFKLTLPHLANLWNTNKSLAGPTAHMGPEEKSKFFEAAGISGGSYGLGGQRYWASQQIGPKSSDYTKAFTPEPRPDNSQMSVRQSMETSRIDDDRVSELGFPLTELGYKRARPTARDMERADSIKDIFVYWIDIIRSSVYNNVQNPIFGPPIVRLTFGMMYRAIPCLVFNYALSYDPNTGYDKDTLIPRVVKVDMELKEIRTGDYGTFQPANPYSVAGENLAGWESVITNSTNEIGGTLDVIPIIGMIGQGG